MEDISIPKLVVDSILSLVVVLVIVGSSFIVAHKRNKDGKEK